MSIFKDPHAVTYDSTAVTGCKGITSTEGSTPRTDISDDGTLTHFVANVGVNGAVHFNDPIEAAKIANKVAESKTLTFMVSDETDTAKTVTISNIKTGGINQTYSNGVPSGASIPFVADTISDPT